MKPAIRVAAGSWASTFDLSPEPKMRELPDAWIF
jgi:hypothetical protein